MTIAEPGPPRLSVVVAATDSPLAAARAVRALAGQATGRVEVIVVSAPSASALIPLAPPASPRPPGEGARSAPPRYLLAPAGSGVPRLRRIGLEAATGRVVVFTEDSCVAGPGWVAAWLGAFADPDLAAATGLVEHPDDAPVVEWAVVFCEYAPFLTPGPAGPPARLAGNNFAVARAVALGEPGDEVHEVSLLASIRRAGGTTRTVPGAVVRHVRRFGFRRAIGDRLRFGLEFGRLRAAGSSTIARRAALIAGPAIFAAQAGRIAGTVLRGRRHLGRFARALPIILAMLAAWSVGESLGWALGGPGRGRLPGRKRRGTAGRTPAPRAGRAGSPPAGCTPGPPLA